MSEVERETLRDIDVQNVVLLPETVQVCVCGRLTELPGEYTTNHSSGWPHLRWFCECGATIYRPINPFDFRRNRLGVVVQREPTLRLAPIDALLEVGSSRQSGTDEVRLMLRVRRRSLSGTVQDVWLPTSGFGIMPPESED